MSALAAMVAKDLRQRFRDRSVLLFGVVSPLVLAVVFSVIVPGQDEVTFHLGVVTSGEPTAVALVEALDDEPALDVDEVADPTTLRRRVADGDLDAGLVVPSGAGTDAAAGRAVRITTVVHPDRPLSGAVAGGIADGVATGLATVAEAVAIARRADPSVTPAVLGEIAARAASATPALTVVAAATDDRRLDATSYLAAAMAVFFVFFVVQIGLTTLLEERRLGTLRRIRSAPVHPAAIVGAKVLTSTIVGVGSMAVLLVSSRLLLGVAWGDPVGVGVLVVVAVLAAVGVLAVVATLARTQEQANAGQSVVAIVLGLLGGAFFPIDSTGVLGALSRLSPHRWFLRGLGDLAGGGGVAAVLGPIAVLLAFAGAGLGIAGLVLVRRGLDAR